MGHDISGFNHAGEEIAYARFSMGNSNAGILYELLDATQFHAGVSGCGRDTNLSLQQMETALRGCNKFLQGVGPVSDDSLLNWDIKQIREFIQNCTATAEKEGSVRVYFG